MAMTTNINYADGTWNPITGCTKASPGCGNCYAAPAAKRLMKMGQEKYSNAFNLTLHPESLHEPLETKTHKYILTCSMSDIFHEDIPVAYIQRVFDVMVEADWHTFMVLTKRSQRLLELSSELPWPSHIWAGVSIENNDYVWRADDLRATGAQKKFISAEPLLGPLPDLNYTGIDWIIVGGESGPGSHPMEESWVLEIRDKCMKQKIAFFFKQWGGFNKKKTGRVLQGHVYDEFPEENFQRK